MKKKLFLLAAALIFVLSAMAQEEIPAKTPDYDYSVSFDFQTRYVWRGQPLGGTSPSLQPGMSFSWKGLTVGAWGAFGFNNQVVQELDLYLSYTFWKERFTVIVTDYSFPDELTDFNYFDYENGHVLEAGISYNGEENVPIAVAIYCNLYGADAKNANGKNSFSTYAELSYNPTFKRIGVDFSIFAGFALHGQKISEGIDPVSGEELFRYGFYGNRTFAPVNLGIKASKSFEIGKLSIPVGTSLIFNPIAKKAYFTASVGVAL
jgi:hypothetical protein